MNRDCWHVVGRCFLWRATCPPERNFTRRSASSFTRRRCVRVSPIAQDSALLTSTEVQGSRCKVPGLYEPEACIGVQEPHSKSGPCLSPRRAGRPLRPATRHRLGGLLSRQQPDGTRAHPEATHKGRARNSKSEIRNNRRGIGQDEQDEEDRDGKGSSLILAILHILLMSGLSDFVLRVSNLLCCGSFERTACAVRRHPVFGRSSGQIAHVLLRRLPLASAKCKVKREKKDLL